MSHRMPALALVLIAIVAVPASAQKAYVRDVAHSQINFVAESQLVDAHGTFDQWDAEIAFDPTNLSASSVLITIDAKSINTRIERRDTHLKSNDFFATDSFPAITFKSTIVNPLADDRVNITGDLTIRGRTKTITIPSRLVFYDAARDAGRVKGETTILRTDFGVDYQPAVNKIQPEIEIQFDISFVAKK
ncbi:MAG: YceI family protein [Gemmatimonadetes bacterium]|nr:YceI family protein [Gemmatimonadota bacterium]